MQILESLACRLYVKPQNERLSGKYTCIGRRRGPRTEFLGPANMLWLEELAEETSAGRTVSQTLVQHFDMY